MDRTKLLYNNLSGSEKKALKVYLNAFNTKGDSKFLDMLGLIEEHPEISHEEAAERLYGDPKSKAFIMMKSRLFEKMTEFLPLSVNPGSNKYSKEMPYYRDLIEFRKSMLLATVLQEKRLTPLALDFFEKGRKLAASCNTPELEVDALLKLRGLDGKDTDRFEELTKEIQVALQKQECDINAIGLYRKYYSMHALKSAGDEEKLSFLVSHIPELEESIRQVNSARADYFLQMLKVNLYYITREYQACKEVCHRAIEILKENEGIRSQQRMSDPWFQLGKLELHFSNYSDALAALRIARDFHPPNTWSYLATSIMMLYGLVYSHEFDAAQALMEEIRPELETRVFHKNPMIRGLYAYLSSCLHYLRGDLQQAWRMLQEIQDLNFDKEGWITGIRIFEIMLLIEKSLPDLASQKLENLRKHLSRYKAEPRMKTIYKLLVAQEKGGFDFSIFPEEGELLNDLQTKLIWDPVGHEVIRFDSWYLAHRKR